MSHLAARKTILVVEDDINYAQIVEFAFAKANLPFDIQMVHNGAEAVSYLSEGAEVKSDNPAAIGLPNLILTDINMPRFSGLELLAWIRKQSKLKDLPVVVMSGFIDPLQEKQITQLGVSFYFIKPLSIQELLNHIETAIDNLNIEPMVAAESCS